MWCPDCRDSRLLFEHISMRHDMFAIYGDRLPLRSGILPHAYAQYEFMEDYVHTYYAYVCVHIATMVLFQSRNPIQSNQAKSYQCFNCKKYGHLLNECKAPRDENVRSQMRKAYMDQKHLGTADTKGYMGQKLSGTNSSIDLSSILSAGLCTNSAPDLSGILFAGLQALTGNVSNEKVSERGRSVWVTGIPEEFRDADFLCNVFGNYGNVQRIKFSQKRPDGALIEMDDVRHASKAARCLHNLNLGEEKILVKPTTIDRAKGVIKDEKSKDYSKARIGRYKKDTKFTKICMKRASKPTSIISVSRLPKGKLTELKKYITKSGCTIKEVKEMKLREGGDKPSSDFGTPVMIELGSAEEAVRAVGKLHNTMPSNMGEKKGTRGLAFSFTNRTDLEEKA